MAGADHRPSGGGRVIHLVLEDSESAPIPGVSQPRPLILADRTCGVQEETPTEETPKSRGGRPPKGDRQKRSVYLERAVWRQLEEMAADEGLPVTVIVARLVYERMAHPVPAYCLPKPSNDQEELPLATAS